jgi:hypothetical protein
MPINPSEEFLKHAAECKRMARFAHGSKDKAAWTRMAERWQQCAEWFDSQTLMVNHYPPTQHRPRDFKFYRH